MSSNKSSKCSKKPRFKFDEFDCFFDCKDPFCCDTITLGKRFKEAAKRFGACLRKHKFDQFQSSTFAPFPGDGWQTSEAYGRLGMETFRFGAANESQLVVPLVNFGQALDVADGFYNNPADGVLGLGFTALAVDHILPPFISAVNQKLVDQPIFSVFLQTDGQVEGQPGGVFTWGRIDTDNCQDVWAWMPLQAADYWVFKMRGVIFSSLKKKNGKWPTTSDQLNRASSWRTIQYQVLNVHYILQCYDNRSRYHARNRQSQLHDPGTLRIDEATKYIIPSGKPNLCFMNFVNYNAQPFKPQWFIGTPLMRQYCHFYDVSKQRLGFAIPKTKSSKK